MKDLPARLKRYIAEVRADAAEYSGNREGLVNGSWNFIAKEHPELAPYRDTFKAGALKGVRR